MRLARSPGAATPLRIPTRIKHRVCFRALPPPHDDRIGAAEAKTALGQSLPTHLAPVLTVVRYASDSDRLGHGSEQTRSAISDRGNFCKNFGSTHILGTHVPVEEPSTASKAEIGRHSFAGYLVVTVCCFTCSSLWFTAVYRSAHIRNIRSTEKPVLTRIQTYRSAQQLICRTFRIFAS
jgi:hypothetical protein